MHCMHFILSFKYHVLNAGGLSLRSKRVACVNDADKIGCG